MKSELDQAVEKFKIALAQAGYHEVRALQKRLEFNEKKNRFSEDSRKQRVIKRRYQDSVILYQD